MKLALKDTKIVNRSQYPGEDGPTQVLRVRSLLTRPLARDLGCFDNCFGENEMPRRFCDLKLTGLVVENAEVDLDGSILLATSVSHFKICHPKEASESDPSLEVQCNLHFDGALPLDDWFVRRNKSQFDLTVTPPADWNAQQSLFEQADPDQQGEDDGDELPVAAGDGEEPIEVHLQGEALERHNALSGAQPALVPAREMGGTHQRRKKVVDIGVN